VSTGDGSKNLMVENGFVVAKWLGFGGVGQNPHIHSTNVSYFMHIQAAGALY
jgi:hypothetical protein